MKHGSFSSENYIYEFYYGGSFNDAIELKKELKRDYNLNGNVVMNGRGWYVRVKK